MHPFTYNYRGIRHESSVEHFKEDGYERYRVTLPSGLDMVIASFGIDPKIWVQSNKAGEMVQPHDLVQAIGAGLRNNNIYQ